MLCCCIMLLKYLQDNIFILCFTAACIVFWVIQRNKASKIQKNCIRLIEDILADSDHTEVSQKQAEYYTYKVSVIKRYLRRHTPYEVYASFLVDVGTDPDFSWQFYSIGSADISNYLEKVSIALRTTVNSLKTVNSILLQLKDIVNANK